MKLTKEQIQFIDTYLKNCNVIYVDIRLEMIDHIASAVEEKMAAESLEFIEAFKEFMLLHKKEIMKNNKRDWAISWSAVKQFLLFLIRPSMLFLLGLLFILFRSTDFNRFFSSDFTFKSLVVVFLLTLALFQSLYIKFYLRKRFFAIEKTGNILVLFYLIQNFVLDFGNNYASEIKFTILSFFLVGYLIFFLKEMIKFNKHRFNYI